MKPINKPNLDQVIAANKNVDKAKLESGLKALGELNRTGAVSPRKFSINLEESFYVPLHE